MRFPEMADDLASSLRNDLTYNLKSSKCYVIHNKLNTSSYVAEKEVQTVDYGNELTEEQIKEYILHHRNEVLTLLDVSENEQRHKCLSPVYPASPSGSTSSVKFKVENDMICFSPTNSASNHQLNMNSRSPTPRKILKKQNNVSRSADQDISFGYKNNSFRSHSLCEDNSELSPMSKRRNFSQRGKQKSTDMSVLQRFQAKFASKKSTSIDDAEPQKLHLTIPEIILNVPDDEYKHRGAYEEKCDINYMEKSSSKSEDNRETMGKDNHVLSISLEKL